MELFDIYPSKIDVNLDLKKVRLFFGDHWEDVGDVELVSVGKGMFDLKLPDMDAFAAELESQNDGRLEWAEWGVMLN